MNAAFAPFHPRITIGALATSLVGAVTSISATIAHAPSNHPTIITGVFVTAVGAIIAALGRSPLQPVIPAGVSIMESNTIVKQIELAGVTYAEGQLEANKPAIIADLQAAGVKAVDFIETSVEKAIGNGGGILAKLGGPTLKSIVSGVAQQTIAGLGGEENALYALVDAELHSIAKSLGGS